MQVQVKIERFKYLGSVLWDGSFEERMKHKIGQIEEVKRSVKYFV